VCVCVCDAKRWQVTECHEMRRWRDEVKRKREGEQERKEEKEGAGKQKEGNLEVFFQQRGRVEVVMVWMVLLASDSTLWLVLMGKVFGFSWV